MWPRSLSRIEERISDKAGSAGVTSSLWRRRQGRRTDDRAGADGGRKLEQPKFYEDGSTMNAGLGEATQRVQTESLMTRIVSAIRAFATLSALRKLPTHVVWRIKAAPEAFIDAIERFAAKY